MIKKMHMVLDKKQRREVFALLLIILLNSVFELLGVSAVLPLIEAVTDTRKAEGKWYFAMIADLLNVHDTVQLIAVFSFILVIVYIVKNCYILWMNHSLYKLVYQNQRKLAVRLMRCYMYQDYSFHVSHNVSELNRNIKDAGSFFTAIQYVLQLFIEVMVCFMLVIYLAIVDIRTTLLITVIMAVLLLLFVGIFRGKLKRLGTKNREYTALRTKWFLQSLNGVKEIKAANKEEFFMMKYDDAYKESANVQQKQVFLSNMPKPVVEMICISAILIYMAVRILAGSDVSGFVPILSVFAVAAFRMLPSFNRISGYLSSIMFNKPSVDAVYEDLMEIEKLKKAELESIGESNEPLHLEKEILLNDIEFSYPSKPDVKVLKKLSLKIPARSAVALVGGSGAGKTTVADIIMGLYEPEGGKVTADGVNIYEHVRSWHNTIAYIPQTIYLIDDTIRANVAFGIPEKEISDERVWQALDDAQLGDFVRSQKNGLDSRIGDRGVKLSGGQRQRIGIARALYTGPELLILDEATSALDNETETAVMEAIYHLAGKLTMLVIAHRITTIKNCDIIYRVENGKAYEIDYAEAESGHDKQDL
ncbi:MAG: ABC transporter ATP-binding protein/permease [Lachnospiraceae bacterium]|nr:ABC transporter ATP-binding protein/permease [Lachnospiraceae bacterium]